MYEPWLDPRFLKIGILGIVEDIYGISIRYYKNYFLSYDSSSGWTGDCL